MLFRSLTHDEQRFDSAVAGLEILLWKVTCSNSPIHVDISLPFYWHYAINYRRLISARSGAPPPRPTDRPTLHEIPQLFPQPCRIAPAESAVWEVPPPVQFIVAGVATRVVVFLDQDQDQTF